MRSTFSRLVGLFLLGTVVVTDSGTGSSWVGPTGSLVCDTAGGFEELGNFDVPVCGDRDPLSNIINDGGGGNNQNGDDPDCQMEPDLCEFFPLPDFAQRTAHETVDQVTSTPPPDVPSVPEPETPQEPPIPSPPEPSAPIPPELPEVAPQPKSNPVTHLPQVLVEIAADSEPVADSPSNQPSAPRDDEVEPISGASQLPSRPGPPGLPLVIVAALTLGALLGTPIVAHYNRLTQERALRNPLRAKVLAIVTESPGATCADVARAVGVHYTTAEHHLRILRRFGRVAAHPASAGFRYFFANGDVPATARQKWLIARRPANVAFLDAARTLGPFRLSQAAAQLGIARSTASRRAQQLRVHGLLSRSGLWWSVPETFLVSAPARPGSESVAPAAAATSVAAPTLAAASGTPHRYALE